ncbi:MAG TPA: asparaginase [Solirubrobacteraceae bacterium]|jgi:L-asparaginase|nr:asparaginase [Solirubrobacteraceae bacterium]
MSTDKGVLVIYTGGTIGSKPRDPDPDSPQVVVPWKELLQGTPELERLPYRVDSYEGIPPLDSCNVGPSQWIEMAECIRDNYEDYNGFVILHGTDTMVSTACALSFMLRDLGKPVIITGAQRSALVSIRNDATQNLLTAVEIANPQASNLPVVPEVCIFFGGKLLRGNRAVKMDTVGYEAYATPNIPPLGTAGDRIVINERLVRPLPERGRRFNVRTRLDRNVLALYISPGIQDTNIAQSQLATEDLRAAVVLSFGSGNIPTKRDFVKAFQRARAENEIILANVSQCPVGPVELGIYETSAELLEAGFISAADITVEAATCKLMALLGDPDASVEDVEWNFQQNLAGEQSVSLFVTNYGPSSRGAVDADHPNNRVRGVPVSGSFESAFVERALIRLRGARVTAADNAASKSASSRGQKGSASEDSPDPIEFSVYLNLDEGAVGKRTDPSYGGTFTKWPMDRDGVVMFDVSGAFRSIVRTGERMSFTVVLDTPTAGQLTWNSAELAVYARETEI